jgi:hypothetical protein
VCTPVEVAVVMYSARPFTEDVARDCDATVLPLRDVIDPPAPPASTPQKNVPPFQRSFSVELLQDERLAPKSVARVRPPVDDALMKERLLVVREVADIVAR